MKVLLKAHIVHFIIKNINKIHVVLFDILKEKHSSGLQGLLMNVLYSEI